MNLTAGVTASDLNEAAQEAEKVGVRSNKQRFFSACLKFLKIIES
jgi:hypothetical protein